MNQDGKPNFSRGRRCIYENDDPGHFVQNGYEVVGEAQDGAQAIEKFKELRPDLITMDITMPEMDGIAALKEIKNRCER